jgi:hypothetical protein
MAETGDGVVTRVSKQRRQGARAVCLIALVWVLGISPRAAQAQVQPAYLHTLSSFSGPLRYDWVRLHVDQARDETYVIYQNIVRIFGPSGMEIFSFGDDLDLGHILDATVDAQGDIILLSYKDSVTLVTKCNFRGVPIVPIDIKNLPAGVPFTANRIIQRNGLFYFASFLTSSVIVTDANGEFRKHIEFIPLLESEDRQKGSAEINGFTVDDSGNIFFTIPTLFKVYKYSSDGTMVSFGRSGSAPGRFGVIAGVATDSQGNLLVADKLKCVIMVFDKNLAFVTEFGYRGAKPGNLIVPDDIAIDGKDRVYVSQGRRRGVSVFALARN